MEIEFVGYFILAFIVGIMLGTFLIFGIIQIINAVSRYDKRKEK